MPTNLPPEAQEAERRYRAAKTTREKIETLQELISAIPKHKGTDKLRAAYRRRLSKLKSAAQSKKKTGKHDTPYSFEREGSGQAVVIGTGNTGKSALVAALTNATPEVSQAPFTTWTPTPGMMEFENVQIQLIDTPSLDRGYVEPELMDLLRRTDLVLLVVDLQTFPIQQLEKAVAILKEHRIIPQHLSDGVDDTRRVTFVPLLVLANKSDDAESEELYELFCGLLEEEWPCLPVSAASGRNLDKLKQFIFEQLELIRVYSKPPGKEADLNSPFVMKKGGTLDEFATKIHQDFSDQLKTARLWGSGSFDGQMIGRDYVLQDGDVVELRI